METPKLKEGNTIEVTSVHLPKLFGGKGIIELVYDKDDQYDYLVCITEYSNGYVLPTPHLEKMYKNEVRLDSVNSINVLPNKSVSMRLLLMGA